MRGHFRPEFLNRIDETVLFSPLTLAQIEKIVDLLMEDLRRRLAARNVNVTLTDAARSHVAEAGFDPVYGARPLKRYLQRELETRIGRSLVAGDVRDGDYVVVDAHEGLLTIRNERPAPEPAPEEASA